MLGVLAVGVVVDGRDLARHHFDTGKRVSFSISHVLFAFNLRIWELMAGEWFSVAAGPVFRVERGKGWKTSSESSSPCVCFVRKKDSVG